MWTTRTSIQSMQCIVLGTVISLLFLACYWSKFISYCWHGSDWVKKSLDLWDSIPNCQFWNSQWAAVIARVIKNYNFIDWECFLPMLFTRYLNLFEVSLWILQLMSVSRLTIDPQCPSHVVKHEPDLFDNAG